MYDYISALILGLLAASIGNLFHWIRKTQKTLTSKKVVFYFCIQTLILGLMFFLAQQFNPERKEDIKEKRNNAVIACNNFYLWLETSNSLFEDTLNRQINEIDSHGNLWMNAGMAMHIIEWAREFRERRNLRIDSILLTLKKYEDYGCDPDTLQYERRLPECLRRKLGPYIYLRKDILNVEILGLDTL